ncbi:UNVERIFIED_CONTAM: hypothetical protein Sradi_6962300 [Sesamum radiatum]|uniref:Uncharacterized protein n=1 Tax=Sesamum radiatum TaxID=300843 RepID=A0AAW2JHG0_SESRA
MIGGRRESGLRKKDGGGGGQSFCRSRIAADLRRIFLGGVFAFLYPDGFFVSSPSVHHSVANSDSEVRLLLFISSYSYMLYPKFSSSLDWKMCV